MSFKQNKYAVVKKAISNYLSLITTKNKSN